MATTRAACELSGYSNSSQTFFWFSLSGNGLSSSLMKPSSSLLTCSVGGEKERVKRNPLELLFIVTKINSGSADSFSKLVSSKSSSSRNGFYLRLACVIFTVIRKGAEYFCRCSSHIYVFRQSFHSYHCQHLHKQEVESLNFFNKKA